MSRRTQTTRLPLLLSGLPAQPVEWLRVAGIPVEPFQSKPSPAQQGWEASEHIVLFDARSAGGRLDARTARECGAEVVNVADLLKPTSGDHHATDCTDAAHAPQDHSVRAAFLGELKRRVERAGGFWLRLADYPFPYRSAICQLRCPGAELPVSAATKAMPGDSLDADGGLHRDDTSVLRFDPAADQELPHPATCREIAARMRDRYEAGLPLFLDDTADQPLPEPAHRSSPSVESAAAECPLTWRTTEHEFIHWWQVRDGLTVTARRSGTTYEIRCEGSFGGYRPMMELWLGSHVASFPLFAETMEVREGGLVFLREQRRHPGGLAAQWSMESNRGRPSFGRCPLPLAEFSERYTHQPV